MEPETVAISRGRRSSPELEPLLLRGGSSCGLSGLYCRSCCFPKLRVVKPRLNELRVERTGQGLRHVKFPHLHLAAKY